MINWNELSLDWSIINDTGIETNTIYSLVNSLTDNYPDILIIDRTNLLVQTYKGLFNTIQDIELLEFSTYYKFKIIVNSLMISFHHKLGLAW